ncbi:hypothetical protein BJX61DRAFT_373553 [Aspergillus egyptiacus]|nr:hypothetical protein BJX61DRAFT_373553 [Aspergillus egyptiacus]
MSSNNNFNKGDNIPPSTVSTVSIAREIGILFGFLVASLVIMAVYAVIWRFVERREEQRDKLRREQLVARGVHHGRGGLHEKMLDHEVFMARAELPVRERREIGGAEVEVEAGRARDVSMSRMREREMSASRARERGREMAGSRSMTPKMF